MTARKNGGQNCRFQKSKYKLKMKGVLFPSLMNGLEPNVQNPEIAIDINPFVVNLFINLLIYCFSLVDGEGSL